MLKTFTKFLVAGTIAFGALFAQNPTKTIKDVDISVGKHVTFSSDTTYILDGMVFVDSMSVLTIEPGTVIKAKDGQGNQASGLVVTRYGKIYAEGTASRPIIFTSINDQMNGNLSHTDRGLWGGIVLLGQASTNNQPAGSLKEIEGVNEIVAQGDNRAKYGGTDDAHSSGVVKYVSIRHTGINVGDQSGNEIQGLTLGAVGSGTVIEYVESYASGDDGFEWFGGTVNCKYLVSAFNEDDAFDWDEGYRGKGQFWFAIQAPDKAGRVAEMDGATGDEYFAPYSHPVISNVTFIGAGVGARPTGDGEELLIFRDNTAGEYYNSIFTDFDGASKGLAITIEDIDNTGSKTEDSRKRFEAGQLKLENNVWYGFGNGNTIDKFSTQDFVINYLKDGSNNNRLSDPMLRGISRKKDGKLDPRLKLSSPALSGSKMLTDNFFVKTSYVGAFGGNNWLTSWTTLDKNGYLKKNISSVKEISSKIPTKFELSQNYPNPFNPSTNIEFKVVTEGNVVLKIYNILGQEVAELVNKEMTPGTYTVQWDASSSASGVYVYRLQAGNNVITKKMMLVK